MAKLILSLDRSVLKEVPLDRERITIGRKPHNDIQIDNLAVSAEHARVVTILGDSFLEDLGSTNGTLVNGKPITKHILQPNDVIEIGKYTLKYIAETVAVSRRINADMDQTMEIPGPARRMAEASAPEPQVDADATVPEAQASAEAALPEPDGSSQASVQILTGGNAGKKLELTKDITTLGKPGVQVVVIARRPHGYFLIHVEGSTYPSVNGKPTGPQAQALKNHDVIELGGIKMEFFLKSS